MGTTDYVGNVPLFRYMTISIICLIGYEYMIMFKYEVRYLWGRRFSLGTVLLALCRYLPFGTILQIYVLFLRVESPLCVNGYRAIAFPVVCLWVLLVIYGRNIIEFISPAVVLFARAYAVWGRARHVLIFLSFVYAGALFGSSYSMVLFLVGIREQKSNLTPHCLLTLGNDDMWIVVVIMVCCESLALGLLLFKAVQHAREMRGFDGKSSTRNLLAVMARDGIIYFFCTLAITTANLIMIARIKVRTSLDNCEALYTNLIKPWVQSDSRDLLLAAQGAIQDILCNRLLIHVQIVNESPGGMIVSYPSLTYDRSALRSMRAQDIKLRDRNTWRDYMGAKFTPPHLEATK
ncbi:hypothetical protein SCHPADRAFT_947166 [Schizopora paradoxa]|uniref:DUF6533 domain-containing protein n=1 Tax=Schizopora paradoxa TaxID=27342 RepID=A0A0H2R096_9AGAM|nr:hypothetical protein SCHPADRAFT_947166 [Schizopora paradoxa]